LATIDLQNGPDPLQASITVGHKMNAILDISFMNNSDAGSQKVKAILKVNGRLCSPGKLSCFGLQSCWSPKHKSISGEHWPPLISKMAFIL
jgi:hypothetical protein